MDPGLSTWHYGLVARWWAEFSIADPDELSYYAAAIRRFGEPALDLGCGTGRILIPLLGEGLDVDGSDVSEDMIAGAAAKVAALGLKTRLGVEPKHELDLDRRYRTIYMCGVFGVGARREQDREALRRAYRHLEPGGALLIGHLLPYSGDDVASWGEWLPTKRPAFPCEWPSHSNRRTASDGDEIELLSREVAFDPLRQTGAMEMRARLWHEGRMVREEAYTLENCIYFAQEIVLMLEEAGFVDLSIDAYAGRPATGFDGTVVFVGRRS